jgi:hypothetical protein
LDFRRESEEYRMKTIDAEKEKLDVKYCIPNWLRDEQIKMSCARFPSRIQYQKIHRTEPIALVCFGPSLNETWEKVKDFKYVMSCSGSHKYLMDKGVVPDWHVEVDPRPHKIKLIGDNISSKTEFLMASCCHPQVFDHLAKYGAKITLWHTYSGEERDRLPNVFPRGDWISTGGSNVGLRALVLCRLLGFTDIHIFGMDGSFDPEGKQKHAAAHPNQAKNFIMAEYGGKQYATTTAFLSSARATFHELEQLSDVSVTFYGDGLVQAMAKVKLPEIKKKNKSVIAFSSPITMSTGYITQNRLLHEQNPVYGITSLNYLDTIKLIYEKIHARSLLDYGCGKGMLGKNLDFPIWEYDPAIPGKDEAPRPADLVVCIDVLEHIEPEFLDITLDDIARCTKLVAFFIVYPNASVKTLPDGRNTHLIQEGRDWWMEKLSEYFIIPEEGVEEKDGYIRFVGARKIRKASIGNIELTNERVAQLTEIA